MAANQEQFIQLLSTLLSTDNNARTQAEEVYSNVPLDSKISYLLASINNSQLAIETRQMAAILLRRLIASDFAAFYSPLSADTQTQFRQHVLLAVQQTTSDSEPSTRTNPVQMEQLRHKVCDLVAEVARNLIDDDGNNQWPEFLQFLFQWASAANIQLKEAALMMFAGVPGVFGNQQNNYLDMIKQMLMQSLQQGQAYEVRFQAVRAVGAFILANEKETQLHKHFSDVLPHMLLVMAESAHQQEDDALFKVLIDLAETAVTFLKPHLVAIFELCMKVVADGEALDSWRHLALETLLTLTEGASAKVRKHTGKYIEQLIPILLEFMTDLDEDEAWSRHDEVAEDEADCNNVVAEAALDRLACALGGKIVLAVVTQRLPQMLGHTDWKQRHAALMAISAIGEGCHKQMQTMLPQMVTGVAGVMPGIIYYLRDPHARVRYAACNCIGQMSTDFEPDFETKFHQEVVAGLLMLLDDDANPRVQAHAGAALVNFSEDCPKHILTGYLDSVMQKLEAVLNAKFQEFLAKGTKLVLEQIVTTIASVADTTEMAFTAYYDRLMPCLKYIVQNAGGKEDLKLLRGKAIECITLIGMAVGAEKFTADATEVMDLLLKTHGGDAGGEMPDDDPQTSYLMSAWSRICKVLGKNFEHYLPVVMGPVMRTASIKPEVAILDSDDMDEMSNDDDWQFVSLSEQKNFGIRTAGLEDKAAACTMLVCYARELKDGFANYAEDTVKLMVPMLKFYFHDGVRTAAAESLPWLLESATCKGPAFVQDMWRFICADLLKALDTEPDNDVLLTLLDSTARCIIILGASCLDQNSMGELLKIINKLMTAHYERADDRTQKHLDEDFDEIVQEQLEDEASDDTYVLSKVAELIHALFSVYRDGFVPYFDQIGPHFVNLLEVHRPWSDRQWGLCIFDDVVEFLGPQCVKYQHLFLQPLALYTRDKAAEVRQAANYGWGVLAQFGGEQFAGECAKIVPVLVDAVQAVDSRESTNATATENAISAVGKILKYNSSMLKIDDILPVWFSWLPVLEDVDEAPHVYGYLCDLIEQNNPHIIGVANENLPRIVHIVATVFHREVLSTSSPEAIRLLHLIRQIQTNDTYFQTVISGLSAEHKHSLHMALTESAAVASSGAATASSPPS